MGLLIGFLRENNLSETLTSLSEETGVQVAYIPNKAEFIENIKKIQAEVLENYSKIVKPGGKLVYATCSVLPSENQEQIKRFLSTEIGKEFNFVKDQKVLASESGFDGFYMALLERKNK